MSDQTADAPAILTAEQIEQLRKDNGTLSRQLTLVQDELADATEKYQALNRAPSEPFQVACLMGDVAELKRQLSTLETRLTEVTRQLADANQRNGLLRFDLDLFAAALGVTGCDDVDAAVTRLNIRCNERDQFKARAESAEGTIRDTVVAVQLERDMTLSGPVETFCTELLARLQP